MLKDYLLLPNGKQTQSGGKKIKIIILKNPQLPILFWSEMSSSGSTKGLSSSSSCPALIHLSFIICYKEKKSYYNILISKANCGKKNSPIYQQQCFFSFVFFRIGPSAYSSFALLQWGERTMHIKASYFPISCTKLKREKPNNTNQKLCYISDKSS